MAQSQIRIVRRPTSASSKQAQQDAATLDLRSPSGKKTLPY